MRRCIQYFLIACLAAAPLQAASADETALKARAARFYELQVAGDRVQAGQLVEPKSRNRFLGGNSIRYTASRVERVRITAPASAEVEVTVDVLLPMFPGPVSRTFVTPWKKVGGRWYFVVDTSAIDEALSKGNPARQEARPALSASPSLVFGQDGEIRRSVRLENNSTGVLRFRIVHVDSDWLEVRNRTGEIPPGESFPLVVVLLQAPAEAQMLTMTIEGVGTDGRITQLEIPVKLETPPPALRRQLQQAIRKYLAEQ